IFRRNSRFGHHALLKEGEGIITVNDLPVGRSVDETLDRVQAFRITDRHGEMCPVGWQPGGDTIKPTVKDSKTSFAKQQ
uniref:thioredoxin-dependent peroxiredoxin n=1 Tax=Salvator merianae TaxID=96440 RepID=A0A8D0KLW7_SALMN